MNSEGEFFLKAGLDEGDYELHSESESENSSDCEDSTSESDSSED